MRAYSISHDRHAFHDGVRIAFQNGTIHECARVTFVSIADDILLIARLILLELPLKACREARATASAETGSLHDVNNFLRGLFREHMVQGFISVDADILIDILRIDAAAVSESDSLLLLIEADLFDIVDFFSGLPVGIEHLEFFDDMSADNVVVHDPLCVFRLYMCVIDAVRINSDDRSLLA